MAATTKLYSTIHTNIPYQQDYTKRISYAVVPMACSVRPKYHFSAVRGNCCVQNVALSRWHKGGQQGHSAETSTMETTQQDCTEGTSNAAIHVQHFSPGGGCAFGCKPLYGLLQFDLSHDVVVIAPKRGRHAHTVYWKPLLQLYAHCL